MATDPQKSDTDERRNAILEAAFKTVAAYGYRRTSMDDIAREAGISRPALYQYFANKQAIFRGIVESAMVETNRAVEEILIQPMSLRQRLEILFEITVLSHHRMLEAMPHGEEILGLKSEIAQDIFDEWDRIKRGQFERALQLEQKMPQGLIVPLANTISHALSGMKAKGLSVSEMEREFGAVVAVVLAVTD